MSASTALQLVRIAFDGLENRIENAHVCEVLGTFVTEPGRNAYAKVEAFIASMPAERFYLGWDMNVYPRFEVRKVEVA